MGLLERLIDDYGEKLGRPVCALLWLIPEREDIEAVRLGIIRSLLHQLRFAVACWIGLGDRIVVIEMAEWRKELEYG